MAEANHVCLTKKEMDAVREPGVSVELEHRVFEAIRDCRTCMNRMWKRLNKPRHHGK